MSLPNTLNSLPVGAGMELQTAINRGGLTPPSQNFAGPLICAIALGCAALCEAIEVTFACVAFCVVVGGICYTIEQMQKRIAELRDLIAKKKAECEGMGPFGPGDHDGWNRYWICRWQLQQLLDELGYLYEALQTQHGPLMRPSTGSSTASGGGRHKPQM